MTKQNKKVEKQCDIHVVRHSLLIMKTEAYFIRHCDNETCDLGAFQYTCPHCNKTVSDYEIWWKQDDMWSGTPEVFKCEKCGESLTVEWDKEEYEYWVH